MTTLTTLSEVLEFIDQAPQEVIIRKNKIYDKQQSLIAIFERKFNNYS